MLAEAEAEALAALGLEEKGAVVVTAAEGWHPGIVGLVAARLKEKFGRPAFAIALEPGGIGTGSGRSIAGVDLGNAVRQAVADGLLVKGGGHAMAAGVTIRRERLAEFRAFLEAALTDAVEAARRDDALLIDGALSAAAANLEFCASAMRAGPFGAGNPEPVFALPAHTDRLCRCGRSAPYPRAAAQRRWRDAQCRSPFARWTPISAARCSRGGGSRSMPPAHCRSTAGRGRSACRCG